MLMLTEATFVPLLARSRTWSRPRTISEKYASLLPPMSVNTWTATMPAEGATPVMLACGRGMPATWVPCSQPDGQGAAEPVPTCV